MIRMGDFNQNRTIPSEMNVLINIHPSLSCKGHLILKQRGRHIVSVVVISLKNER